MQEPAKSRACTRVCRARTRFHVSEAFRAYSATANLCACSLPALACNHMGDGGPMVVNFRFTLVCEAWTTVLDARRRVKLFWPTLACSCADVGSGGERSGEGRRCARGGASWSGAMRLFPLLCFVLWQAPLHGSSRLTPYPRKVGSSQVRRAVE